MRSWSNGVKVWAATALLAAGSGAVLPQTASARVYTGACSIAVDGKTYLKRARGCQIDMFKDGSFSVGTGKPAQRYFAYVTMLGGGRAQASWNQDPKARHAHAPLGDDFHQEGGCWVGERARICAFR